MRLWALTCSVSIRAQKQSGDVQLHGFILTNPILNIVGYIGTVYIGNFNYVLWMLGVNFIVAILGVVVWTTALWTTDNSELYCNALYTGPSLNAFGINVSRKNWLLLQEL